MPSHDLESGEKWESLGLLREAIEEYTRLIALDLSPVRALLRKAALHHQLGEIVQAQDDLEQAAALAPDDPLPQLHLGQLAGVCARNLVEVRHMQRAVELAPDSYEMRINAAAAYLRIDWLDRAYAVIRDLPEALPDWWGSTRHRAISRHREQRDAMRALLQGRRAASDRILFEWELALRAFELGRLVLSAKYCRSLMQELPESFPAFVLYSKVLARAEGVPASVAFIRSVAWLHGKHPDYAIVLARLLQEQGAFEEVLAVGSSAIEPDQSEDWRYIKAAAMLLLGQGDRLRNYCRSWLAVAPASVAPAGLLASEHARTARPNAKGVTIVQFWDKKDIPADVAAVMASWSEHHPGVERVVFDEAEARDFVAAHFGSEAADTYDLCHHAAMKADYFRIAFLLQRGGVWADADERCVRPMHHVLRTAMTSDLVATLSGEVPGYIHNWFLGSRPESPILRHAFGDATAGIRAAQAEGVRPDIWHVTGPGLITRAVANYLAINDATASVDELLLLSFRQYRTLALTDGTLAYKSRAGGNWQLA